jgi:RNA-directed DNA polymerase
VKGGKWYSLIDKVQSETTLKAAFTEVAANKGAAGVDHVSSSVSRRTRTQICNA